MLSAWVPSARPNGAPEMTYGRSIGKALDRFNIGREWWPELAADRAAWRTVRIARDLIGREGWHGFEGI